MVAKILQESLKIADGGRVECTLTDSGREVKGYIEQSFFEDTWGTTMPNESQQVQFVRDNLKYLEAEANRQLEKGRTAVLIR